MAQQQVAEKLIVKPERQLEEVSHVVCCDDDAGAVALCGTDVSHMPWKDEEATCVVCDDLERVNVCPAYGRCPWA